MKRFLILAVLLAMALPLMAAPIVAGTEGSSELTYGFIIGQDGYKSRWTNLIWTTVAQVNESNYILFGVTGRNRLDEGMVDFGVRAFSGNMILDKVLSLPEKVTLKLKFGWDDVVAYNAPPSGYAYENQMGYDPGPRGTVAVLGSLYGVSYRVALDPGMSLSQFGIPVAPATLLANVYGNIGPILLSAAYYSNKNDLQFGKVGAEAQLNLASGLFGFTFDAEENYDFNSPYPLTIGLAAVVTYGWLAIDASTNFGGTSVLKMNAFGVGIEARPDTELKRFGASLGFDFNLDSTVPQLFRSVDGSVWFKALGPGKLRIGYLWTATGNGGGDYYAPAALPNGGAYLKYDMSW